MAHRRSGYFSSTCDIQRRDRNARPCFVPVLTKGASPAIAPAAVVLVSAQWSSGHALGGRFAGLPPARQAAFNRSEEHTSELQSRQYLVCRLLLEKKTQNT